MRVLFKGTQGSDVRILQAYLNLIQDGSFSVLTEENKNINITSKIKYHLNNVKRYLPDKKDLWKKEK